MSEQKEAPRTPSARGVLSPGMWGVLAAVGVVALIGVGIAVWLFTAPARETTSPTATPSATSAATPGPVPEATPTTGSEVLPPEGGGVSDRIPPLEPSTPLVTPPLPDSASDQGQLVDGYPVDVMGPAAGSDVVESSISTEGDRMQVSLIARTDATREEVSRHYAELWASLGLLPQPGGADGALAYASTFESLSLAFTPASGTGTVYMIHGVFRTS